MTENMLPPRPGKHRKGATNTHSFRCTDETWEAAKERAEKDGVPMSYVMEQFIVGYATGKMSLPVVTVQYE